MLRYALLLILTLVSSQTVSAAIVRIADGDCVGLSNAAAAATASGQTTILLARDGTYATCAFSIAAGAIEIDGQGATLQYPVASIAAGASLVMRNVSITAPAAGATVSPICNYPSDMGPFHPASDAICNAGSLSLDTVTIHDMTVGVPCSSAQNYCVIGDLINSLLGGISLRNTTVANFHGGFLFAYSGVSIYNSTFTQFDGGPLISAAKQTNVDKSMVVANSLFASGNVAVCSDANTFVSLGGNVATESSCGFSASAGDKILQDGGLGTFDSHGGLIPTQAIAFGSPARGAGVAQYCEAVDARGYTRAPNGCDAGAYEYGGGPGALTASGLNGFYYDPDANGHYVSLQRVHDNGDIVIVWNTFDQRGNQAWIYGVGQLSGQHIHAAMSQNVGGVLQAGGPPTGSSVRPWGTVDIDLTSCLLAQFNYQSTLANFGSGQFPLTRLALVSDFGCSD